MSSSKNIPVNLNNSPFRLDILKGCTTVITGGHSGIGLGISECFASHGSNVVMIGRRKKVLDKVALDLTNKYSSSKNPIKCLGFVGDVRDFNSLVSIREKIEKKDGGLGVNSIDFLINCAAGNFLCLAEHLTPNAFRTVIEIDLIGTFNTSKCFFPFLKNSKNGASIINISATLHYSATTYQIHPSAAKAGIDSLTRSLANEWGPYNIRVNGVAPGPIANTEGISRLSQGAEQFIAQSVPVRRLGTSHDIGFTCLFLASPQCSSFLSGDTIIVDGASWVSKNPMIPRQMYDEMREKRLKHKKQKQQSKL